MHHFNNSRNGPILAIDLGGTKIAISLVTTSGDLIGLRRISTDAHLGGKVVMGRIVSLARQIYREIEEIDKNQVPIAMGVSSAWLIDPDTGVIAYSLEDTPGWEDVPIQDQLEQTLGLPAFIDGDANVMTLGEAIQGVARNYRHVIGLTVGTGVGGGIVVDGKIYHGAQGFAANFGHMIIDYRGKRKCPCGRFGCLEAYASGPSMVASFIKRVGRNQMRQKYILDPALVGVKDIHELAQTGQSDALLVIQEGAHFLGLGVATLINIFNPDVIVIGGGISQIGDPYFKEIRNTVKEHVLPILSETPVLPAMFGAESNLIGAACLAWQGLAHRSKVTKSWISP